MFKKGNCINTNIAIWFEYLHISTLTEILLWYHLYRRKLISQVCVSALILSDKHVTYSFYF